MLLDSGLPLEFWAEALSHRTWIWNRTLTASRHQIPEIAFANNDLALDELTRTPVFGCLAFASTHPTMSLKKFAPRGHVGIFLGHAEMEKAFRLWNVSGGRVEVVRSVSFDVERFPATELGIDPRNQMRRLTADRHRLPVGNSAIAGNQSRPRPIAVDPVSYLLVEGQRGLRQQKIRDGVGVEADYPHDSILPGGDDLGDSVSIESEGSLHGSVEEFTSLEGSTAAAPLITGGRMMATEIEEVLPPESQQGLRRSSRHRTAKKRFDIEGAHPTLTTSTVLQTAVMKKGPRTPPLSITEAWSGPEAEQWKLATDKERNRLLIQYRTLGPLCPRPRNRKCLVLGQKWVFGYKISTDGQVIGHRTRSVSKGYMDRRQDNDTYSPVAQHEAASIVFALSAAASPPWTHAQYDIPAAYLQGRRDRDGSAVEVFLEQLDGYTDPDRPTDVHPLIGNLYGTRDAGRVWHLAIDPVLTGNCRLTKSGYGQCIYHRSDGAGKFLFVVLYVDDLRAVGNAPAWLDLLRNELARHFGVKVLEGTQNLFLGTDISVAPGLVTLNQKLKIEKLLDDEGLANCKAVSTPADTNWHPESESEELPPKGQQWFRSVMGTLGYTSEHVRPDISYVVCILRRYQGRATMVHKALVKRVLRYLRGTVDLALAYSRQTPEKSNVLVAFADASFADNFDARKSTTGFVICLNGGAVLWRSKRQRITALSTAEAE